MRVVYVWISHKMYLWHFQFNISLWYNFDLSSSSITFLVFNIFVLDVRKCSNIIVHTYFLYRQVIWSWSNIKYTNWKLAMEACKLCQNISNYFSNKSCNQLCIWVTSIKIMEVTGSFMPGMSWLPPLFTNLSSENNSLLLSSIKMPNFDELFVFFPSGSQVRCISISLYLLWKCLW